MRKFKFILFAVTLTLWGCLASQPVYHKQGAKQTSAAVITEDALYDSAVVCFRNKNYGRSESLFLQIMAEYPASDYAQRAAYMNGYLYTIGDNPKKNYAAAKERFELFGKYYPKSRYISDSRSWISVIAELEQARAGGKTVSCDSLAAVNKQLQEEVRKLNFMIEQFREAQDKETKK